MSDIMSMTLTRRARRMIGNVIRAVPLLRRTICPSTDYRVITAAEARDANDTVTSGWLRPLTAMRQERAYKNLLRDMRNGHAREDLRVAAQAVDALGLSRASLLEVGCGSGYYSEVFDALAKTSIDYTGIDFSPAMIFRAKQAYPGRDFALGDATNLTFSDASFDVVFNGVSLMHIMDYETAIMESARVAKFACIFHSVPIFPDFATTYLRKYAYGSPVTEVVFGRSSLVDCFEKNGLEVRQTWKAMDYDVSGVTGARSFSKTFLCTPKAQA